MADSSPPGESPPPSPNPGFGASQRNVPTEPDLPGVGPPKKPPPAPKPFEGLDDLERIAMEEDEFEDYMKRVLRDLFEPEKPPPARLPGESFGRGQRNVPTAPDLPAKPPTPPSRFEGLDNLEKAAAEDEFDDFMKRELKDLAEPPRRPSPRPAGPEPARPPPAGRIRAARLLGAFGLALGAALVAWIGTAMFEHAADDVIKKLGPGDDLTPLLPSNPKAMWVIAEFRRIDRERSDPHYEPNVVAQEITIVPPVNGVLAIGIPLQGLPPLFSSDCDINRRGAGNSDWLFQPFSDHLIGRSASRADPLRKDVPTTVTLHFHLPGFEAHKLAAERTGAIRVYLIAP